MNDLETVAHWVERALRAEAANRKASETVGPHFIGEAQPRAPLKSDDTVPLAVASASPEKQRDYLLCEVGSLLADVAELRRIQALLVDQKLAYFDALLKIAPETARTLARANI